MLIHKHFLLFVWNVDIAFNKENYIVKPEVKPRYMRYSVCVVSQYTFFGLFLWFDTQKSLVTCDFLICRLTSYADHETSNPFIYTAMFTLIRGLLWHKLWLTMFRMMTFYFYFFHIYVNNKNLLSLFIRFLIRMLVCIISILFASSLYLIFYEQVFKNLLIASFNNYYYNFMAFPKRKTSCKN